MNIQLLCYAENTELPRVAEHLIRIHIQWHNRKQKIRTTCIEWNVVQSSVFELLHLRYSTPKCFIHSPILRRVFEPLKPRLSQTISIYPYMGEFDTLSRPRLILNPGLYCISSVCKHSIEKQERGSSNNEGGRSRVTARAKSPQSSTVGHLSLLRTHGTRE